MPTRRRPLLRAGFALAATSGLAGCLDSIHRLRETYPIVVLVQNATVDNAVVTLSVIVDDEPIFEERIEVDARHYAERTLPERAGRHRAVASTDEVEDQIEWAVTWQDLADCNSNFLEIRLTDDGLSLHAYRSEIDCGHPLDRL